MLDIRTMEHEEVTELKFSDDPDDAAILSKLQYCVVMTTLSGDNDMSIASEGDAEALIKALRFAIDNDWFKWPDEGDIDLNEDL